jgi:anhydro-N-acetylmuramic acid kinase
VTGRAGAPGRAVESPVLVGLMSGTSLDGISAAVVRFHGDGAAHRDAELLAFHLAPYPPERRARVAAAITGASPAEYCRLGADLGHWLADAALAAIAEAGVPRDAIRAIASHGQTIWHVPGHSTWQLGESAVIAERTGCDVIADFRVRDVAAGGQGAPLVPMADAMLFADPAAWRILQNVGGIANLTVVPPGGEPIAVRAFDTGPGVVVVDAVTRLVSPGQPYDVDGRLARSGRPIAAVVDDMLAAPYFSAWPPKSTGRELFTPEWIAAFVEACRVASPGASAGDLVATAVELTARSIALAVERFVPEPVSDVLVSGGGARNPALMESLQRVLAPRPVRPFASAYFDGDAKEAVAFALLGLLFLEGRPGNLVTATGARGPRILGKLTPA